MTMPTKKQTDQAADGAVGATIGFRLETEPRRILTERAAQLGISPHALARDYVLEILGEAEERVALRQAIQTLSQELANTHECLALAVEALLISAGKVEVPKARAWVEKTFQ